MTSIYDFTVRNIHDQPVDLAQYRGKVMLIVNTASQCGFTPQYKGLQALYDSYKDRGFVVLGFPCNQFGKQEPGNHEEIQTFCEKSYGVSFPMFAKIDVNGEQAHPLYKYLKHAAPGVLGTEAIKWNFTKFLVGKNGADIKRYATRTPPEALTADIEKRLD